MRAMSRLLDPSLWRGLLRVAPAADPFAVRDPAFIRDELERLAWYTERYHHSEVTGLEHIPDGAALAVGSHNGGVACPDMFALMLAFWRHFGVESPAFGLMHDLVFHVPIIGGYLSRLGAVPARPENALAGLARGARVLVYPGGDIDAYKPFARRHEIRFGERRGFIRIALKARVPIVPIVSAGAHETFIVLDDGVETSRRLGIKRLTRLEVIPLIAGLPWGLFVGPAPFLPLPVSVKVRALPPIAWPDLPAGAADDRDTVERCFEEVRARMQDALDDLVREGGFGLRGRFATMA
jgi:1-acyl-sn-glycerol-3-phosphate acyltransferase